VSLTQLVEGVTAAQKATKPMGAKINPAGIQPSRPSSDNLIYVDQHSHVYVPQMIEFDVALGTTEAEDGKAGAGLVVGPVLLGSRIESRSEAATFSRVKFSVPLILPSGD